MPRIRTLKPEHRQHRKVGPLSDRAYRLWVGMILEADDEGRLVADAGQLRAVIFPYHPRVRVPEVEAMILALETAGLIHLYGIGDDKRIAQLHDWEDHQTARQSWSFTPSRLPNQAGEILDLGRHPSDAARWAIYERDQFTCVYCAADLRQRMKEITLDHVIPISGGGAISRVISRPRAGAATSRRMAAPPPRRACRGRRGSARRPSAKPTPSRRGLDGCGGGWTGNRKGT